MYSHGMSGLNGLVSSSLYASFGDSELLLNYATLMLNFAAKFGFVQIV